MKKAAWMVALVLGLAPVTMAFAETTVTVDNDQTTVTTGQPAPIQTVAVTATPVIIAQERNEKEFEGEIIRVDYPNSLIVVRDRDGRDRKVIVKQGMINNYKVDDYVEVTLMADMKEAKMIHIVRDLPRFEGRVIAVDSNVNHIIIREGNGKERTVLVATGMTTYFKAGDSVRIYAVPDQQREVRFIRVLG